MTGKKGRSGRIAGGKPWYNVPGDVKDLWEYRDRLSKAGFNLKILKVDLSFFDEIEITTPSEKWVLGCDPKGKLIIGDAPNPVHIRTVAIYDDQRIKLPSKLYNDMKLRHNKSMQIFMCGEGLYLRPVDEIPISDAGKCSNCNELLHKSSKNKRMCSTKIQGEEYIFCSLICRKEFRKKWAFVGQK